MSGPQAKKPVPAPLRTIGDIRAALRSGHRFSDDQASFAADLQRALEASSETDLSAVASVSSTTEAGSVSATTLTSTRRYRKASISWDA